MLIFARIRVMTDTDSGVKLYHYLIKVSGQGNLQTRPYRLLMVVLWVFLTHQKGPRRGIFLAQPPPPPPLDPAYSASARPGSSSS